MKKILLFLFVLPIMVNAQEVVPNPYDFGKMWTFENPPKEWFKEAYDFDPGDEWFDDVRKSSLRFATWCSASFISADGLIMTNHHCSRDVVGPLQQDGENFDKQGFYAATLADERKSEGLFVEQLIHAIDITPEIMALTKNASEVDMEDKKQDAIKEIEEKYKAMPEWADLRTQLVTYYSGGKYSLYGYKRYDDIRLVLVPELDLGFFGGDPDNFTYPRYNLDVTLWRAYDENGKPLNTSANYLKFNKDGANEGDPVFVVGNPGSTERYRSVAQLEYDRDYRYPSTYKFLKNRNDKLMKDYNEMKDDPGREFEAQALLNNIAGIANGMKAYGGIVKGLNDPELFGRKVAMENYIKSKSPGVTYWDDMREAYSKLNKHGWAISHLRANPLRGSTSMLLSQLYSYATDLQGEEKLSDAKKSDYINNISGVAQNIDTDEERMMLTMWLTEMKEDVYPGDDTVDKLLGGKTISEYVDYLMSESKLTSLDSAKKFLEKGKKMMKKGDPMLDAAMIINDRFKMAAEAFGESGKYRKGLEQKIANQTFKVYGTSLPPDATFTLRISDGTMKGYDYNGTTAPVFTTYYGLYDRHYSHNQEFPWDLPERWMNPPHEFLRSPYNCVSTNDIIGGNSGSPLINKNKEAVGLIFDGNIESLPGNFIFDEEANRTVSVHASGIWAALKYIYKADRILQELEK